MFSVNYIRGCVCRTGTGSQLYQLACWVHNDYDVYSMNSQ